jgi:hypothetical protein
VAIRGLHTLVSRIYTSPPAAAKYYPQLLQCSKIPLDVSKRPHAPAKPKSNNSGGKPSTKVDARSEPTSPLFDTKIAPQTIAARGSRCRYTADVWLSA